MNAEKLLIIIIIKMTNVIMSWTLILYTHYMDKSIGTPF